MVLPTLTSEGALTVVEVYHNPKIQKQSVTIMRVRRATHQGTLCHIIRSSLPKMQQQQQQQQQQRIPDRRSVRGALRGAGSLVS